MILLLKAKHVSKMLFVVIDKHFHDSRNFAVLAPGREFFSAKCVQFPLSIME